MRALILFFFLAGCDTADVVDTSVGIDTVPDTDIPLVMQDPPDRTGPGWYLRPDQHLETCAPDVNGFHTVQAEFVINIMNCTSSPPVVEDEAQLYCAKITSATYVASHGYWLVQCASLDQILVQILNKISY